MAKLNYPKYRFGLFLIEQNKFKNNNYNNNNSNNNNTQTGQQTIVFADTYEIQTDGSIIFYQVELSGDKKFRVPVLAYPNGKWDACVLLDDDNKYPVFSPRNNSQDKKQPTMADYRNQPIGNDAFTNNSSDFSLKKEDRGNDNSNNSSSSDPFEDNPPSNNTSNNNQNWSRNPLNNGSSVSTAMPGVTNTNTAEYKKLKNDYLEVQVKEYAKQNNSFIVKDFQDMLAKDPKSKEFKITEIDIEWVVSTLIREKLVLQRKFSDPVIQKKLALILPDIMRRQWNGKMAIIIQTLQEREETKNVNAIDLAVWMVQNNFEN